MSPSINLRNTVSIALAVAILLFLLFLLSPLRLLALIYDDRVITSPAFQEPASPDIVVVRITEDTLARLPYRSPIDRDFLSDLVQSLLAAKPKSIGIDILFDQATEASKDKRFQNVLINNKDTVSVAYATLSDGLTDKQFEFQHEYLEEARKASIVLARDSQDGVVRHVRNNRLVGDILLKSLAFSMSGNILESPADRFDKVAYQSNPDGTPFRFTAYPAESVALLPAEWFSNKHVLIGMDVPGIDRLRTPFVATFGDTVGVRPGVEIHAHILNQLLKDTGPKKTSALAEFVSMFFGGLAGVILMLLRTHVWIRWALVILALSVLLGACLLVFSRFTLIIPYVPIALALIASAMVATVLLWQKVRNQKKYIEDAWTHYVSPEIVNNLIANPEKLKLGGQRVDASYVFTDIGGFTAMSEKMSPEELTSVVNRYLDLVSGEFVKAGATLDKIVGDAVVGFFGAPVPDPDHPNKAVQLAMDLDKACKAFKKELDDEGVKIGNTRIGIHSGISVVGNFGGTSFFDYTAFGDSVNTAARLEDANKMFGGTVCVSGDTAGRAIDHRFRPIGRLYLAGKEKPVEAWEPILCNDTTNDVLDSYMIAYEYLDKDPDKAMKLLKKMARAKPEDTLVQYQLNRLKAGLHGTTLVHSKKL